MDMPCSHLLWRDINKALCPCKFLFYFIVVSPKNVNSTIDMLYTYSESQTRLCLIAAGIPLVHSLKSRYNPVYAMLNLPFSFNVKVRSMISDS